MDDETLYVKLILHEVDDFIHRKIVDLYPELESFMDDETLCVKLILHEIDDFIHRKIVDLLGRRLLYS